MGWADKMRRMDETLRRDGKGLVGGTALPSPLVVHDQIGRPLGVGDQVVLTPPHIVAVVQSVTPVMHPGAPPGLARVTFHAYVGMHAPVGGLAEGVFRLHTAAEIQAARQGAGEGQGEDPPAAEPPAADLPQDPPQDPPSGIVLP